MSSEAYQEAVLRAIAVTQQALDEMAVQASLSEELGDSEREVRQVRAEALLAAMHRGRQSL